MTGTRRDVTTRKRVVSQVPPGNAVSLTAPTAPTHQAKHVVRLVHTAVYLVKGKVVYAYLSGLTLFAPESSYLNSFYLGFYFLFSIFDVYILF